MFSKYKVTLEVKQQCLSCGLDTSSLVSIYFFSSNRFNVGCGADFTHTLSIYSLVFNDSISTIIYEFDTGLFFGFVVPLNATRFFSLRTKTHSLFYDENAEKCLIFINCKRPLPKRAGQADAEALLLPRSVRSRTNYVIFITLYFQFSGFSVINSKTECTKDKASLLHFLLWTNVLSRFHSLCHYPFAYKEARNSLLIQFCLFQWFGDDFYKILLLFLALFSSLKILIRLSLFGYRNVWTVAVCDRP